MLGFLDTRNLLALGLGALLLIVGATAGVQTVRVALLRADLAAEKAGRQEDARLAAEAAARASEEAREAERQHAEAEQEILNGYRNEIAHRDAALAAARIDTDSLRDEVQQYASGGGGQPAAAATAACGDYRDRAATLGNLLEGCQRLAGNLAAAAEKHAGEARVLKHQVEVDRLACGGSYDRSGKSGP